jgi:hypothetical protein
VLAEAKLNNALNYVLLKRAMGKISAPPFLTFFGMIEIE